MVICYTITMIESKRDSEIFLRGFVGIPIYLKKKENLRIYPKIIFENGDVFKFSTDVDARKCKDIVHYANLIALKHVLSQLADLKLDFTLKFYPTDHKISFEYNDEFLHDGHFSNQTQDTDVWKEIIKIIHDAKIKLIIEENESYLTYINKVDTL